MTSQTLQKIREARAVSTPLIAIATADPYAAAEALAAEYNPEKNAKQSAGNVPPIIGWDCVRGYFPINEQARDAIAGMIPKVDDIGLPGPAPAPAANPVEALTIAYGAAPKGAFLLYWNAHFLMDNPQALQAIANLRDPFKGDRRTAILFAPSWKLPPVLSQDTLVLDDPLPTAAELRGLIEAEIENFGNSRIAGADWTKPAADDIDKATAALAGLARFPGEQSVALSLRNHKALNQDLLWSRKNSYIAQTRGLVVEDTRNTTLTDVIGLDAITSHLQRTCEGREGPALFVRLEELEKQLAGAKGDNTGVSQDLLSVILTAMEDYEWNGAIAFGVPGAGKSLLSRAIAGHYQMPCLTLDLGALKESLVGSSEANARAAVKTLYAIGGRRVYFLASCNGVATIPAALRSRFSDGLWFFDFMGPEALAGVWSYYRAKYEIPQDDAQPAAANWTPREIRNCCRCAYRLRITLTEAARTIVPVAIADAPGIKAMREQAHGAFLDATSGGIYQNPGTSNTGRAADDVKSRMYDE